MARSNSKAREKYVNRELSLLEFQRRVLDEARSNDNPLLERIKFLSIFSSNVDEFFMVRVGGLRLQNKSGVVDLSLDGLTPAEQLAEIRKLALELMKEARQLFEDVLQPELAEAGIHLLDFSELAPKQKTQVKRYFEEVVFPVLTPLAFDPGHPFPHISNLSLSLAAVIRDADGAEKFARVKVPAILPRLVPIKRSSGSVKKDGTVPYNHYFVWIEQVIAAYMDSLFPGMKVVDSHPFRITRNADISIQELEASDLLESMEENVRQRQFADVVRLSINEDMTDKIRQILIENLAMDEAGVYQLRGPLGLRNLMELMNVDRFDLKDRPFIPNVPRALQFESADGNMFAAIRQGDILLHHPYDSFNPVIEFLRAAARDPNVLAIKQTLYRVGRNSPVVQTLLEARRDYGKQVAVLVELKARFDEESNISWARVLEEEGVHVIYGLLGLKTHSKILLVVRREGESIRRYVHIGTGNYNAFTSHVYEDLGMLTADDKIGEDATNVFNYLTGFSQKSNYNKLLVAPINMRKQLEMKIRREIRLQKKSGDGRLIFKMNSLVDRSIIDLLYEASRAGVQIDLLVRGICSLRPGVPRLSENIRVVSIVGRFLEHSRVYYFRNGGKEEMYIGSADLMSRNIDRRVEILAPVSDPRLVQHLRDQVLLGYLDDNIKSRVMKPDGSYEYMKKPKGNKARNTQEWLLTQQLPSEGD